MKRTASILLLTLLAFNWIGYRLLSVYWEHQSDIAIEEKIDRQEYDENLLIELRVPLNAPYLGYNNSTDFERVNGEIEISGVHYEYVKRKVENGELVLMCLPHEAKTRILNSRVDFVKMMNDVNQSADGKTKNTTSFKSFTTEYKPENNSWNIPAVAITGVSNNASVVCFINDGFNAIPEQPPRA